MGMSGSGLPTANEPKEDQAGVGAIVGGSLPAGGRDMGATTATSDTAGRGERRWREEEPTKNGKDPKSSSAGASRGSGRKAGGVDGQTDGSRNITAVPRRLFITALQ